MIPKILTNKTVLTGLESSFLKSSSAFKPVFGDAAYMGKVVQTSPTLVHGPMQGSFKADLGAFLKVGPEGLGSPKCILKKPFR